MKARRKGDAGPFEDVHKIVISRGLYANYIPINDVEFEQELHTFNPDTDYKILWDQVRIDAAIQVLPQCVKTVQDILFRGGSLNADETIPDQVASSALLYADALINKLKEGCNSHSE